MHRAIEKKEGRKGDKPIRSDFKGEKKYEIQGQHTRNNNETKKKKEGEQTQEEEQGRKKEVDHLDLPKKNNVKPKPKLRSFQMKNEKIETRKEVLLSLTIVVGIQKTQIVEFFV